MPSAANRASKPAAQKPAASALPNTTVHLQLYPTFPVQFATDADPQQRQRRNFLIYQLF